MRNQEWNATLAQLYPLNFAELVFRLFCRDAVHGETTLGVVHKTEVLAGLLDADDVHEASRVSHVSSDLAVDLDKTLHEDGSGLAEVERILQSALR